jgi:hypothetical protein
MGHEGGMGALFNCVKLIGNGERQDGECSNLLYCKLQMRIADLPVVDHAIALEPDCHPGLRAGQI